jgi:ferredoxin
MSDSPAFRVVIDHDICNGQGVCYTTAPDVFGADADGYGAVTVETIAGSERARMERVVQLCPELAIRIEELDGSSAAEST